MCTKRILFACLGMFLTGLSSTAMGQTTVTFQQGVDGYNGLTEIYTGLLGVGVGDVNGDGNAQTDGNINSVTLGSEFAAVFLDGRYNRAENAGGDTQGLFRFDDIFGSGAGQIPPGARIISANMELTTAAIPNSGTNEAPHVVARLLVPFDANSNYAATGRGLRFAQGEPEPTGGQRLEPVPTGETARPLAGGFVNVTSPVLGGTITLAAGNVGRADITKIVQEWQSGAANHGVVVLSGTQNGWGINTSSAATAANRPRLSVVFDMLPEPNTTSETFTVSDDDSTNSMFLIHNFNGRFANTDTTGYFNVNFTDGRNALFEEVSFIIPDDGPLLNNGIGQRVLIRYDSIFVSEGGSVPDDAIIESARLVINTPNFWFPDDHIQGDNTTPPGQGASLNINTNTLYGVRQVLTDYDGTAQGTSDDLTFGAVADEDLRTGTISDTASEFDVTEIVQSWQTSGNNFGFSISGESNFNNGWAILNSQSDVGAPQLIVTYQSTGLLGDFDGDGDVDLLDLDRYSGSIGLTIAANPTLVDLDLDGNGTIQEADLEQHYSTLVETSNGGKGTFAGDANLDGIVDVVNDAFVVVANLNGSTTSWAQGDFNASGNVDVVGDAFLLVANLGNSNGS